MQQIYENDLNFSISVFVVEHKLPSEEMMEVFAPVHANRGIIASR